MCDSTQIYDAKNIKKIIASWNKNKKILITDKATPSFNVI